jgi:hypothetical protein
MEFKTKVQETTHYRFEDERGVFFCRIRDVSSFNIAGRGVTVSLNNGNVWRTTSIVSIDTISASAAIGEAGARVEIAFDAVSNNRE